ncbi:DUF2059 domain-containing protein [Bradyrhizobium ontarionense]|uniref:DUF2059 domain-containing protein n=1 Tax=Bradyrhizobium ontarionense TaxID=2898149 RepID=A0ABY3RIL0_9BRAD|nr:DUF2059 domain-containing protein [Bradyrhizobium sp. A19]UFZ06637.1 DUF2059 domain-containing protein [Bradyrhizobium sp. A19]
MRERILITVAVVLALTGVARAQPPSPDGLAAARRLVATMKLPEQYKAMLPTILLGIKPALVQDRPEIERDYDAMAAAVSDAYAPFYDAMVDGVSALYANTFTVDELRQIEAFYRSAVGQKFLAEAPALAQRREIIVQDIGRKAGDELKARLTDSLRQKGHRL